MWYAEYRLVACGTQNTGWQHVVRRMESGVSRRVAVCIGPEHGTVGPELIKDAAKEAVQGIGFDLLIVCGFAFDPHVPEEMKRYGKLTILITRMNPDLSMGDDILKKTGAGNLFMVFGEPDIELKSNRTINLWSRLKAWTCMIPPPGRSGQIPPMT